MKTKIFKNIFFVAMAVFVCSVAIVTIGLFGYFSAQSRSALKGEAAYIAAAVERNGTDFLNDVKKENVSRITLIDKDGSIIFETGNKTDSGYIANEQVTLSSGKTLCVYGQKITVLSVVISMFYQLVFVVVLAIVLSLFLASRVAKAIVKPINEINLENPDDRDAYVELKPLVERICSQNQQIHRQMKALKKEHENQDKLRRQFTANVSHELKTPLTAISGTAEIIRDGLVKPEDVSHFAGNIYNETKRLISLVGDIIKLSELEECEEDYETAQVDLLENAGCVAQRMETVAAVKNIKIEVTGEHISLNVPPVLIDEIIFNLCDNAIKYNKDGGEVKLNVTQDEKYIVLSVADTGIGMREKEIDRIFERFYRINKSRSKEVGGTGLGLSIVKHAAINLKAEIEVKSELNCGTEIFVKFNKSFYVKPQKQI